MSSDHFFGFSKEIPPIFNKLVPVQNKTPNRRKHKRFIPQYNTLVYNADFFGNIIDISRSGLAFSYPADQILLKEMLLELDIFCGYQKILIHKIPCKTIADFPIMQSPDDPEQKNRRRCMQFDSLSTEQSTLLDHFLPSHE